MIYNYICVSVVCQITWNHVNQTRACSKSVLGGKIRPVTPILFVSTIYARAALVWTEEKRSLRKMRNLKQTELHRLKEQRKERLRTRREKERKTKRISAWLFSKDCSGVMKMSWREN